VNKIPGRPDLKSGLPMPAALSLVLVLIPLALVLLGLVHGDRGAFGQRR